MLKNRVSAIKTTLNIIFYIMVILLLLFYDEVYYKFEMFSIAIVLQISRMCVAGRQAGFELVLGIVGLLLFIAPSVALLHTNSLDPVYFTLFYFVLADIMIYVRRRIISIPDFDLNSSNERIRRKSGNIKLLFLVLMVWCAVAGSFLPNTQLSSYVSFLLPFSIILYLFERIIVYEGFSSSIYIYLTGVLFVVFLYMVLYWSGYGRLLVGAYILIPLLILNYYKDIGLRMWKIVLISPIALYIAQMSRYGEIESIEQIFVGSAGHHIVVTHELMTRDVFNFTQGFGQFFDQLVLFFLNWVPRALWINKPLGAGSTSVDDLYGREGFDENYSQSLGFVGEQIYLLGPYYLLGLFSMIVILMGMNRLVLKYSKGYVTPLIAWEVSLISYIWGGMATFGSRVWFIILPCLFLIRYFSKKI